MKHDAVTSGFTHVTREVKDRSYDPRVARSEASREQSASLLGKMAVRAKADAEIHSGTAIIAEEQQARELEQLRASRLQEMMRQQEEKGTQAAPGEHAKIDEKQFCERLQQQHRSGEGMTIAHFPEEGGEFSEWIDGHLKRRCYKYAKTTFVTVPEQAAANMPFINELPAVVCFDGNEIGGILEPTGDRHLDEDDFCLDVDRWLAMMHEHHTPM